MAKAGKNTLKIITNLKDYEPHLKSKLLDAILRLVWRIRTGLNFPSPVLVLFHPSPAILPRCLILSTLPNPVLGLANHQQWRWWCWCHAVVGDGL